MPAWSPVCNWSPGLVLGFAPTGSHLWWGPLSAAAREILEVVRWRPGNPAEVAPLMDEFWCTEMFLFRPWTGPCTQAASTCKRFPFLSPSWQVSSPIISQLGLIKTTGQRQSEDACLLSPASRPHSGTGTLPLQHCQEHMRQQMKRHQLSLLHTCIQQGVEPKAYMSKSLG